MFTKKDKKRVEDLIIKKMDSIFNTNNEMNQPGMDRRESKMVTVDNFMRKTDDGGNPANSYPPTAT